MFFSVIKCFGGSFHGANIASMKFSGRDKGILKAGIHAGSLSLPGERIALRDNQWQSTQLGILSEGFSGEVGKQRQTLQGFVYTSSSGLNPVSFLFPCGTATTPYSHFCQCNCSNKPSQGQY